MHFVNALVQMAIVTCWQSIKLLSLSPSLLCIDFFFKEVCPFEYCSIFSQERYHHPKLPHLHSKLTMGPQAEGVIFPYYIILMVVVSRRIEASKTR